MEPGYAVKSSSYKNPAKFGDSIVSEQNTLKNCVKENVKKDVECGIN